MNQKLKLRLSLFYRGMSDYFSNPKLVATADDNAYQAGRECAEEIVGYGTDCNPGEIMNEHLLDAEIWPES
jgi:hypothetical protein